MNNLSEATFIFDKFPTIETKRFWLREAKEEDYLEVYEIYSSEEAVKYQGMKNMTTFEQAKKSIMSFKKGFKEKRFIRWCIEDKNTNKVVGTITLHDFDFDESTVQIGYMLNIKYWRKNIMTECGLEVLKYAFEALKFKSVQAYIHPGNIASIKLNEKLGFINKKIIKEVVFNLNSEVFEDRVLYEKGCNYGVCI